MSYYPILKAPDAHGWTTLCNFAPNNWEVTRNSAMSVNVTWPSADGWVTKSLTMLEPHAMRTFTSADIARLVPEDALALLSLTLSVPPAFSDSLPKLGTLQTTVPAWRATLGLSTTTGQTSYQGEIDPFTPQGTLLTFGPFIQYGVDIQNFLILLNIENSPVYRYAELEIYTADGDFKGQFKVRNNESNIIPLDSFGFQPDELPVFICRGMAGIPLYFSRTADGSFLSLEHTHPPSSLVVHGRRWEAQKILKTRWFNRGRE